MTGGKAPRAAGDRFERACVERLRVAGFLVIRSAGSHGPADLVALRSDRAPALVQCKLGGAMTKYARAQFLETAVNVGAVAVIASKPERGHISWRLVLNNNGTCVDYSII